MKKLFALLALLITVSLVLSACAPATAPVSETSNEAPDPDNPGNSVWTQDYIIEIPPS